MRRSLGRMGSALLSLVCCFAVAGAANQAVAAEAPRAVHGSADIFAAPGVAIAWGVLRGATEAVDARRRARRRRSRPRSARWASSASIPSRSANRACCRRRPRRPASTFACRARSSPTFRAPSSACSHPPTPAPNEPPKLVVFYLGVPDTTPEFASEASARNLSRRTHRPRARRRGEEDAMTMTRIELARLLDHSVLKPEAVEADVQSGADTVRTWQIGYFCVQPCWVSLAARRLAGTTAMVASVIGFPHGADRTGREGPGRCARRGRRRRRNRHGAEFRRAQERASRRGRRRHRSRGARRARHRGQGDPRNRGADRRGEERGVPTGARSRRRFRQDVDRLSPGRRRHRRRRAPDARRRRSRHGRQGVGRDSQPRRCARDARRRREPHRHVRERRDSRGASSD